MLYLNMRLYTSKKIIKFYDDDLPMRQKCGVGKEVVI
jgi:hypothetical protein